MRVSGLDHREGVGVGVAPVSLTRQSTKPGQAPCKNADFLDWDAFGYALAEHIRYRNDPGGRDERLTRAERRRQVAIAA